MRTTGEWWTGWVTTFAWLWANLGRMAADEYSSPHAGTSSGLALAGGCSKDGFLLTTSDRQLPGDNSLSDPCVTCVLAVLRPVMGPARSRLSIHDPDKASVRPVKIALKSLFERTLPLKPLRSIICLEKSLSPSKQGICRQWQGTSQPVFRKWKPLRLQVHQQCSQSIARPRTASPGLVCRRRHKGTFFRFGVKY